jgi:hypothetical protein
MGVGRGRRADAADTATAVLPHRVDCGIEVWEGATMGGQADVVHNEIDGPVQGPVVQARDIHGSVTPTDQSRTVNLAALGLDSTQVQQAGRDIHNYCDRPDAPGPGLSSVVVPARVEHQVRGRATLVADVTRSVGSDAGHVVLLHAGGGYGKTTVAVEVAHVVRDERTVWWVDATTRSMLIKGLRDVALEAGAAVEVVRAAWVGDGSAPDVLWRALEGMAQRWLLVIDNVDDA